VYIWNDEVERKELGLVTYPHWISYVPAGRVPVKVKFLAEREQELIVAGAQVD
jgi:hypothetical protein